MLKMDWSQVIGRIALGVTVLLTAMSLGLLSAVAPPLALQLGAFCIVLVGLGAGYAWARHVGMQNQQLAVYLFLFWAWVINMPAIVAFDPSGLTRMDLFNPQSLSRIALFFLIGSAFLLNSLDTTGHSAPRLTPVGRFFLLPALVYAWYMVDALLVLNGMGLLLALYRIAEWALLLLLIAALLARAPLDMAERQTWLLRVAFAILLFMLLITVVLLPIFPRMVYQFGQSGAGRLQNPFAHANTLGVLAAMAFFYFLEIKPKFFRLGMLLAFAVMAATYSRGAWAGFILSTAFYVYLRPKTSHGRIFVVIAMVFLVALGWATKDAFMEPVERILARGGSTTNLASASERTEVWKAAQVLIEEAPFLGHGFVAGPKKLGDVMASGKTGSYFRAPHAHNELIQTQINGGVPASLLLIVFWGRLLFLLKSVSKFVDPHFFRCVTTWVIMIGAFGMLTPNMSGQQMVLGALLLYLYLTLEMFNAERCKSAADLASTKRSALWLRRAPH